jgi:hypothetical protein
MNARAQVNSQNGMKLFLQTEPGTIVSLFRREGCAVGACGDVVGFRYQGTAERMNFQMNFNVNFHMNLHTTWATNLIGRQAVE